MGLLSRVKSLVTKDLVSKDTEGGTRPGPWYLPLSGGFLPADSPLNWWQIGRNVEGFGASAVVEACVSAYSQTVATCPGDHWKTNPDNGRTRITTSALSRILRYPNSYQSISDFMLNAVRSLYLTGNAYALALRNNRFEISELHLMDSRNSAAYIGENGEIFYSLGGNQVVDMMFGVNAVMVPQRDVLHLRLHIGPGRRTLIGETPLVAALNDIAFGDAAMRQQINFYLNQAKPSAVLTTDMVLTTEQTRELRQLWDAQTRGTGSGGTPILTSGLKPQVISTAMRDAQLAEMAKLSEQHIAMAFRIPLQILGLGGGSGNTEELMQNWIASGLGFCLNHVEEALGHLFDLSGYPDEYVEFSTDALLRSAMKDRIEAFARGVQGGIYSPNEARAEFALPKAEAGDEPRVQQQVVPLSAANNIPAAPGAPGPEGAPTTPRPVANPAAVSAQTPTPAKDLSDVTKRWATDFISSADRIDRRAAVH